MSTSQRPLTIGRKLTANVEIQLMRGDCPGGNRGVSSEIDTGAVLID